MINTKPLRYDELTHEMWVRSVSTGLLGQIRHCEDKGTKLTHVILFGHASVTASRHDYYYRRALPQKREWWQFVTPNCPHKHAHSMNPFFMVENTFGDDKYLAVYGKCIETGCMQPVNFGKDEKVTQTPPKLFPVLTLRDTEIGTKVRRPYANDPDEEDCTVVSFVKSGISHTLDKTTLGITGVRYSIKTPNGFYYGWDEFVTLQLVPQPVSKMVDFDYAKVEKRIAQLDKCDCGAKEAEYHRSWCKEFKNLPPCKGTFEFASQAPKGDPVFVSAACFDAYHKQHPVQTTFNRDKQQVLFHREEDRMWVRNPAIGRVRRVWTMAKGLHKVEE